MTQWLPQQRLVLDGDRQVLFAATKNVFLMRE